MFKTGLLILTKPLNQVKGRIPAYLDEINRLVSKTVYIHIQPDQEIRQPDHDAIYRPKLLPLTPPVRNVIHDLLSAGSSTCTKVDIRILLDHITNGNVPLRKYHLKEACDLVLIDSLIPENARAGFMQSLCSAFNVKDNAAFQTCGGEQTGEATVVETGDSSSTEQGEELISQYGHTVLGGTFVLFQEEELISQYGHTVLGGTFDRLHTGHKVMLSEGCLLGLNTLTVGVTEPSLNTKKTLSELIQPVSERIAGVQDYVTDVKPSLEYRITPIADPCGPTATDDTMDLIVLSQETQKGGKMINDIRTENKMDSLLEYTIDLVEDACRGATDEVKVSSSSLRKRLLGTVYRPLKASITGGERPYIIGLTGGIASGKSSICRRLEGLGAKVVDCDKLGHRAYVKDSPGFQKVVDAFGADIVGNDGEIDRKLLGPKVFSDKSQLERLNGIVWPEILRLAQEQIQTFKQEGSKPTVVVLDAAVLLEAGWDDITHEVWTTVVPPAEAVKRMIDRNKLTEEQAESRLASQISNSERVDRANVVLCTLWEYDYTQQQVEKAWALLMERIQTQPSSSSSSSSTAAKTSSNM